MRQFLALRMPEEIRHELERLELELARVTHGWRWVPAGNIHLTLRFLGEVGPERDCAARDVWRRAVQPLAPFHCRVRGLGRFPPAGRPRVLWGGVEDLLPGGRLDDLAERIERAARAVGHAPAERAFRAHLTLARAARNARTTTPPALEFASLAEVRVDRVVLFRSEPKPTGARYTALAEFPLEGQG